MLSNRNVDERQETEILQFNLLGRMFISMWFRLSKTKLAWSGKTQLAHAVKKSAGLLCVKAHDPFTKRLFGYYKGCPLQTC